MKKVLLTTALLLSVSASALAGGLLTNTNQNAVFLRNPARDAIIGIDGVYSNPAGVAFLPQGLHLSLSWQAAIQKREITSYAPFYALNANNPNPEHYFEGKSVVPVIPSVQAAYVFNDKWSVSAQFAVGGGGGKCDFEKGLPMFEQLVGGQMAQQIFPGTPYSFSQNLVGKQYFYGIQVGATYKVHKNISVFGGVRGVIARAGYEGAIRDITINGMNSAALAQASAMYAQAGDVATAQMLGYASQVTQDYVLDCAQKGFGVTPIIGVDFNLGKWNLAAKYEFRTKIELENESKNSPNVDAAFAAYANGAKVRSDIPALLTVGAQYSILDNVRAMAGFHYYFDKDAKGSATAVDKNTWELTFGAEWDVNKWLTVSAGAQRTKYGFDDTMQDTNFNICSTALCLGASFRVSEMVKINAGYMHSFYEDHEIHKNTNMSDLYTRKNDVVGISVDLKF